MAHQILALDMAGTPFKWISAERAIQYLAKDAVAWSLGDTVKTFRGGVQRQTGEITELSAPAIIAVRGSDIIVQGEPFVATSVDRELLFRRDRFVCAYCGDKFPEKMLTKEHIIAQSKGGPDTWMNVVTACKSCNGKKADKSLKESGFELLYVPYVPNRWEHFILQGRNILVDQMEYLMAKVPKNSRLRN